MHERKEGRVLVVDDEPMVRETLGRVLRDEGYDVDLAIDGNHALECVYAARPDAILLDLMMPGMNGRQFLQELRADPAYAHVPVLLMTAVHGMSVNLAQLGASEVVEKPFEAEDLLNKVALAVYRSRQADPMPMPVLPIVPPPVERDRGVVLVVEHDRGHLQHLDVSLSERGYTVVSMTRALVQLSRLARALQPRAILVDLDSDGAADVLRDLAGLPLLAYRRDDPGTRIDDDELVAFVERSR